MLFIMSKGKRKGGLFKTSLIAVAVAATVTIAGIVFMGAKGASPFAQVTAPPESPLACTDSDGGINLSTRGEARQGQKQVVDFCQENNYIFEVDCGTSGGIKESRHPGLGGTQYKCPDGTVCKEGACVISSESSCGNGICEANEGVVGCDPPEEGPDPCTSYVLCPADCADRTCPPIVQICTPPLPGCTYKPSFYTDGCQMPCGILQCENQQSCKDSDGGKNPNIKGTIVAYIRSSTTGKLEKVEAMDSCVDGTNPLEVIENFCTTDGLGGQNWYSISVQCPNGCKDGACISSPPCAPIVCPNGDEFPTCDESGNPMNYFQSPCIGGGSACGNGICEFREGPYQPGCPNERPGPPCTLRSPVFLGTCPRDCTYHTWGEEPEVFPPVPVAGFENEVRVAPLVSVFSDVKSGPEVAAAAQALAERGIIGGYPDGTFREERPVNRAELAKFLLLAKGSSVPDRTNNGGFRDVLEGEWYVKFVMEAAAQGVIGGYPDGTFRPANTVNVAEFLKMTTRTFSLPENIPYTYADVTSQDWFSPYVGLAERFDLFGRSNTLNPAHLLTRGEVAVALQKVLTIMK